MMSTSSAPSDRRSGPPLWLVEGLDIMESRRRIVLGVAGLIIVVGLLLALLAPGVLPPTPLVGAAVALAALLVGVAAAIVVDSSDLRVRGPRHVVAAGGELVAVLPSELDEEAADDFASVVLEARESDRSMLLGLAASSLDIAATLRWTDALGLALARRGVSVLRVDLASGRSDDPGLAEVAAKECRLTEVVDYESGLLLARLGAGDDHRAALAALVDLPAKLPRDLEVLLVALPIAASRGVVQAARGLDHVLVVAERGGTSRVDLIAGLDALRAAELQAQVILLDDLTAARIAGSGTAAEVVPVRSRPEGTDAAGYEVAPGGDATAELGDDIAGGVPDDGAATEPTIAQATAVPASTEPVARSEAASVADLSVDGEPTAEDESATEVPDASPIEDDAATASAVPPSDVAADDEPDEDGPPPPPAIALAAVARTERHEDDPEPADPDDPSARVAAIVRAVMREHDQPTERSTSRP